MKKKGLLASLYSLSAWGILIGSTGCGNPLKNGVMDLSFIAKTDGPRTLLVTNSNPTNSRTFTLTWGGSSPSVTAYCVLENDLNVSDCNWVPSNQLPSSYQVGVSNEEKVLAVWVKSPSGHVDVLPSVSNAVTLDTVAPTLASVSVSNASPTSTQTYNLSFGTLSESISAWCIQENNTTVGDCTWTTATSLPSTYSVSATNNAKTLSVWVKDPAGNISASPVSSSAVTLDTVRPTVASFAVTNSDPTATQTYALSTGALSESISKYCILENDTDVSHCTWTSGASVPATFTVSALNDAKVLSLWVKDVAGNASAAPVSSNSVSLDSAEPSLASVTVTNTNPTNSTTYHLTYGLLNKAITSYCILENDTTFADCSWTTATSLPSTFTVSSTNNAKVLSIWVKDHTGTPSSSVVSSNSVTLDTVAPTVASFSITDASPSYTLTYDLSFGAVSETISQYCIQENDTTVGDCTWTTATSLPSTYTVGSTNNAKVLSVWVKDVAGNVSTTRSSNSVTLDTSAPTVASFTVSNSSPTNSQTYNLSFGALSKTISKYCILENDTTVAHCSWTSATVLPTTYSVTSTNNAKVLTVWVKDTAGTASASGVNSNSVTLDTTLPTLASVTVTNTSPTNTRTYGLTYGTLSESISAYCILENDTTVGDCSWTTASSLPSSYTVTTTQNAKVISVFVKDLAGNISASAVSSGSVTLDTTAPTLASVTISNTSPTNTRTYGLSYGTLSETISGYCILENDTTVGDCSWTAATSLPSTYTVTAANGAKTLSVYIKDAAGNVSASAVSSSSVTLDTVAPTVTVNNASGQAVAINTATSGSPIQFAVVFSEAIAPASFTTSSITNTGTATGITWALTTSDNITYVLKATAVTGEGTLIPTLAAGVVHDPAGNNNTASTSTTNSVTYDVTPPAFTANQMQINGSTTPATTNSNTLQVSLTATDTATNITHFLLKYNDTSQPLVTDANWIPVNGSPPGLTLGKTLTLSNFYYQIGFTNNDYAVSAWVKDAAGNISSQTSTAKKDQLTVHYTPINPPAVINVSATSTDNPTTIGQADLTSASGTALYIRWNVSTTGSLAASPVKIQYTTTDTAVSWTDIGTAGTTYPNSQGSGCSITAGTHTGCFVWTNNVSSAYYRIRVVATDSIGQSAMAPAPALNTWPPINFLAGNTDDGLNGSAKSAVLFHAASGDVHILVVQPNGRIFFRDSVRGLLTVDPSTGVISTFIPMTGTESGDSGLATSATIKDTNARIYGNPTGTALYLYDNNKIKRIDVNNSSFSSSTITTIIGCGTSCGNASQYADTLSNALLMSNPVNGLVVFQVYPMPNGDLYFTGARDSSGASIANNRIFKYKASDGSISAIYRTGTGDRGSISADATTCQSASFGVAYDNTTSTPSNFIFSINSNGTGCPAIAGGLKTNASGVSLGAPTTVHPVVSYYPLSGLDGKVYSYSGTAIYQYDNASNTSTKIVGNASAPNTSGFAGHCSDGTLATSCNADLVDFFVTATGQKYFVDRGQIRLIDSQGNVQTVAGQNKSFGDSGLASSARFGTLYDVEVWNDGTNDRLVAYDFTEFRLREINVGTGIITSLAGDGSARVIDIGGTTALNGYLSGNLNSSHFALNSSGDIYFQTYSSSFVYRIGLLTRSTGVWTTLMGAGATSYNSAVTASSPGPVPTPVGTPTPTPSPAPTKGSDLSFYGVGNILGFDGANLVMGSTGVSGGGSNVLRSYDSTNQYIGFNIAGSGGATSSYATTGWKVGSPLASTQDVVPGAYASAWSPGVYDSYSGSWFMANQVNKAIYQAKADGTGNLISFVSLSNFPAAFAYKRNAGLTVNIIYYCSTGGKIYKRDLIANPSGPDVLLTWPVSSMKCGNSLRWRGSNLVFPYTQNGLYGIAEYVNP